MQPRCTRAQATGSGDKGRPGRPRLEAEMHVIKAAGDPASDPPRAGARRVDLTEEANAPRR